MGKIKYLDFYPTDLQPYLNLKMHRDATVYNNRDGMKLDFIAPVT